ncbi:ATPase domain-containing protein [Halobacteriales archaeon Cl-PHB]
MSEDGDDGETQQARSGGPRATAPEPLAEPPTTGAVGATGDGDRCDFCRLPCPGDPVTLEREGITYHFCSEACRQALADSDRVFTQYHGFRRMQTGVAALDTSLPQGMPRNSFVMLSDLAGTRSESLQAEIAWRALQRGEPVVVVSFLEPPVSLVQEFVGLDWNVLPALENGDLRIVDCFSYRVDDRERMFERLDPWNSHVWNVAREATETVRDPSDMGELQNRLDSALEDLGMQDEGVVVLDSLTELGSLVQPVQAYSVVKDVRADVCKGRFVPVFASATVSGDADGFPHDLGYMADGIVEMQLNDEIVKDALVKQIRVRKLSGVLSYPQWLAYEYSPGTGIVTFDPEAQLSQAAEADGRGGQGGAEVSQGGERAGGAAEGTGQGEGQAQGGAHQPARGADQAGRAPDTTGSDEGAPPNTDG